MTGNIVLQLRQSSGAQPEVLQGRIFFLELGHFDKHFVKTTGKKAPQNYFFEF